MLGTFDGGQVGLEEVGRFANAPVRLPDGLYWDALGLFREVERGLAVAARSGAEVASVGVDSWGVDFALLDRDGALVSNPRHYRDARTEGMVEEALGAVEARELYRATGGLQTMRINTLYQLLAMRGSPLLGAADRLLMVPDLVNYWLTGEKANERTNATTTQLFDGRRGAWARELARRIGLPDGLLGGRIVEPGTQLGWLLPHVAEATGLPKVTPVVAVASHDTASAVVAVPAEGADFAYVSSGTWSLVGVETEEPVVTEGAFRHNFTNEGGFGGTNRFLKNVMGLWILQECRREWARRGRERSYEELQRLAESAAPLRALIDPDHPSFLEPGGMPGKVGAYLKATGQPEASGIGQTVRCVLESLALKYRWVIEWAEELSGQSAKAVHVVGGGSRNGLLCQMTADATGRPVLAGPAEATAVGNVMVQAYAAGEVGSLGEIREVVRGSARPVAYEPGEGRRDAYEEAYARLLRIMCAGAKHYGDEAAALDSREKIVGVSKVEKGRV